MPNTLTATARRFAALALLAGALTGAACAETDAQAGAQADAADSAVALRFAVLGDAEPKPEAAFPGVEAAVRDINALAERQPIDFVIGVGDIAHKGTIIQYENVTPVLQQIHLPFYPIMGNEEHNSTVERYLEYANLWTEGRVEFDSPSYVVDHGPIVMVHASPDHGREFEDSGIDWMLEQVTAAAPTPVFLVVHGAQIGVYSENADKGIHNPRFAEVIAQPNLAAVISGDLHMDIDRVDHSKQIDHVHYLHIPALERTKIPDETRHTPMFRVFTLMESGEVVVDTYETGVSEPLDRHAYTFMLRETRQ